jgi:hypothetical protein
MPRIPAMQLRATLVAFTGGEPFGDAELESLVLLDRESLDLHVPDRAAGEMLVLRRHGDHVERPLDCPDGPGRASDVISKEQQASRAQHTAHPGDGAAVIRDGTRRERADHRVEAGIGEGSASASASRRPTVRRLATASSGITTSAAAATARPGTECPRRPGRQPARRTSRRSAGQRASRGPRRCHTTMPAAANSITESRPNPTRAIDPAATPAVIATAASAVIQAMLAYSNMNPQRRSHPGPDGGRGGVRAHRQLPVMTGRSAGNWPKFRVLSGAVPPASAGP